MISSKRHSRSARPKRSSRSLARARNSKNAYHPPATQPLKQLAQQGRVQGGILPLGNSLKENHSRANGNRGRRSQSRSRYQQYMSGNGIAGLMNQNSNKDICPAQRQVFPLFLLVARFEIGKGSEGEGVFCYSYISNLV